MRWKTNPQRRNRIRNHVFTRAELLSAFQGVLSVPHDVSVLTPLSFRLRPAGMRADDPGYSIIVQRSAFRMRAEVVLDALGGRMRAAILAGVRANPDSVSRAEAAIRQVGWGPEIRVSDYDLYIGAVDQEMTVAEEDELLASCVSVASALSEFVLAQLVVTKRIETRPAADREISSPIEESPVWEYDPSERDRATLEHRLLENWLISRVREEGLQPLDPVRGPQFDLAWMVGETLVICEVKTTSGDEVKQLRLGLGQVLHYRAQATRDTSMNVRAALLVESQPQDGIWQELCEYLEVVLFWPDDGPLPLSLRVP